MRIYIYYQLIFETIVASSIKEYGRSCYVECGNAGLSLLHDNEWEVIVNVCRVSSTGRQKEVSTCISKFFLECIIKVLNIS